MVANEVISCSQHGFVQKITPSQTHPMLWQRNRPWMGVAVNLLRIDLSKAFDTTSETS